MSSSMRLGLALAVLLTAMATRVHAQPALGECDPPLPLVPLHPETRQEVMAREARTLYGLGLLQQRQDRLVEATRTLEEAVKLAPEAVPLYRTLIPLYLVLARTEDAFSACRQALDLDPGDYETWLLYGQHLKIQGRLKEARAALARATTCAGLAEHPEIRVQANYDLASLCEEAQDSEAALKAFGEVVRVLDQPEALLDSGPYSLEQLREQAANTYERMIKLCIQARKYDQALALFQKARKDYPALAVRLNFNLARLCVAQGKPAEALGYLQEYLKTQPEGTEPYELEIDLLERLGRARDVLGALTEAAQRDPHNVGLHLLLARQYHRDGQPRQAEELYKALARESPTPEVYRGLLLLYRDQKRLGEVLEVLQESVSKSSRKDTEPGDADAAARARAILSVLQSDAALVKALLPEVRTWLQRTDRPSFQTLYFLAVLAARTHQLDDAEQLFRGCLARNASSPPMEVAVYDGLLKVLWEAHKYAAVVDLCRQGLRRGQFANSLMFHVDLARAYALLGKSDESVAEADKAVELANDENRLRVRLLRVSMLSFADRYDRAEKECQDLLRETTQPKDVRDVRYELSGVYTQQRNLPRAEDMLQKILQDDSNDASACNDLGYLWADQNKNLEEAERLIRKALRLDEEQRKNADQVGTDDGQDNAAYVDSLGWVLFRRGQLQAARELLEKAVALPAGQNDPLVWDHLGDVCFRLEDTAKARAVWLKAKELYETEKRRKADEQYKELKHKLELLNAGTRRP